MRKSRYNCYHYLYPEKKEAIRLNLARSYLKAGQRRKRTFRMSFVASLLWMSWVVTLPSPGASKSVLPYLSAMVVASCIVETAKKSLKRNFEQQQEAKSLYHRVTKCQTQDEFYQIMHKVNRHFAVHSY